VQEQVGRGWGTVTGLALVTLVAPAINPALLVFVPLALLIVALARGRPLLLGFGIYVIVFSVAGSASTPVGYVGRGWAMLLAAWFLIAVVVLPRAGFLSRGLVAICGTLVTASVFLVLNRGSWTYVDWVFASHFRDVATDAVALTVLRAPDSPLVARMTEGVHRFAEMQALLYPALLGLASLAGLGIAWWAFHRLVAHETRPLGSLRELRFRDELVWALIVGLLLIIAPLGELASRLGYNVVAFMGTLYALRGFAVLLVVFGLRGVGSLVFTLAAVIFPPVIPATLLVGVTDTWLDWRARRAAARPGS